MKTIFAVIFIILFFVNISIYHKIFSVIYFDLFGGLLQECMICGVITLGEMALIHSALISLLGWLGTAFGWILTIFFWIVRIAIVIVIITGIYLLIKEPQKTKERCSEWFKSFNFTKAEQKEVKSNEYKNEANSK